MTIKISINLALSCPSSNILLFMSNLEDQDTPVESNEQERDGSEATSPRRRNGSSAQGGDGPKSKRFRIMTEEEEYKWSLPQDMASYSGGCNPINWLNQTKRNLTIEYINLNFVTRPKLIPLHSFFAEKVFISCFWLIPVLLVGSMDSVPRPSFFDTDILQHILSDLKFSTRTVTVDIFN